MRSLGCNRALVLLDGSRIEPADKRSTVNVDNIPAALVRAVDVVTGGANVDDPFRNDERVNVSTVSGGNPNLRPEYADTHVFGLVYEPSWFEGFRIPLTVTMWTSLMRWPH